MTAKIYHNPNCGTSRNVLALLRHFGLKIEIIEYLTNPPSAQELAALINAAGLSVREAIRDKQPEFLSNGLDDQALTDDQLLAIMVDVPILINRPFVVTDHGTRLARPSEVALEILPRQNVGPFFKEDGSPIERANGEPL